MLESCGNGVIDVNLGEECDDGNTLSGDGCERCLIQRCGNGRREPSESCEVEERGCTANCEPLPCYDSACPNVTWVNFAGGAFSIGSNDLLAPIHERPERNLRIPSFELSRTEVTFAQYKVCVDSGACTEPQGICMRRYNSCTSDGI